MSTQTRQARSSSREGLDIRKINMLNQSDRYPDNHGKTRKSKSRRVRFCFSKQFILHHITDFSYHVSTNPTFTAFASVSRGYLRYDLEALGCRGLQQNISVQLCLRFEWHFSFPTYLDQLTDSSSSLQSEPCPKKRHTDLMQFVTIQTKLSKRDVTMAAWSVYSLHSKHAQNISKRYMVFLVCFGRLVSMN